MSNTRETPSPGLDTQQVLSKCEKHKSHFISQDGGGDKKLPNLSGLKQSFSFCLQYMPIEDQLGALLSLFSPGTLADGASAVIIAEQKGALEGLSLAVKCSGLEMHTCPPHILLSKGNLMALPNLKRGEQGSTILLCT